MTTSPSANIVNVVPWSLRVGERDLFLVEVGCLSPSGEVFTGWGEAGVSSAEDLVEATARARPLLVGADALDTASLFERCRALLTDPRDEGGLSGALAALDVALWDLAARALGVPCWRLAGGAHFASLEIAATLPAGAAESELCGCARAAMERGFCALRMDISPDPVAGVQAVHAVRRAVGAQARIVVDAGGALTDVEAALEVGRGLARADAYWCEDLLGTERFADWGRVCREVLAPVAGGKGFEDEAEAWRCLRAGGVEILTPDPRVWGGISGLRALGVLGRVMGVRVAPYPGDVPLTFLAAAHAVLATASATPLLPCPDEALAQMMDLAEPVAGPTHRPTMAPGLGAVVRRDWVERHARPLPEAGP